MLKFVDKKAWFGYIVDIMKSLMSLGQWPYHLSVWIKFFQYMGYIVEKSHSKE